jgi:hypothetical protein
MGPSVDQQDVCAVLARAAFRDGAAGQSSAHDENIVCLY